MKVEAKIVVRSSKDNLWSVISNIKNANKVISSIENIVILNEPTNGIVGLKWQETRMYFGKPASIDKLIIDASENEFYKTKSEMDGYVYITTMSILEIEDKIILSSTHETKSLNIIAKLKSIPMIFFKGVLKKAIEKDLQDIKTVVESL